MARGGYSGTLVAVLCMLSFFCGSFLRGLKELPEADRGITVTGPAARDKKLLETNNRESGGAAQMSTSQRAEHAEHAGPHPSPMYSSFEEAVEGSGLLRGRPPQMSGDTGHSFYTVQPFQLLSWHPRAYLLPGFIDPQRTQRIIDLAEARLRPSKLALKKGDTEENTQGIRTSQGAYLTRGDDREGVLAWLEDKIAAVVGVPTGHGEPFNVLRYENGQHYDSHHDAFPEEQYGPQSNQRVATLLLYLSTPEEGGETVFLLEGEGGLGRLRSIDYKSCDTGIRVKPRAGDALLFWSLHLNGTIDKQSLHGGCPVIKGTKWVLTKWMRQNCMRKEFC